jgi:hypothetical protein
MEWVPALFREWFKSLTVFSGEVPDDGKASRLCSLDCRCATLSVAATSVSSVSLNHVLSTGEVTGFAGIKHGSIERIQTRTRLGPIVQLGPIIQVGPIAQLNHELGLGSRERFRPRVFFFHGRLDEVSRSCR